MKHFKLKTPVHSPLSKPIPSRHKYGAHYLPSKLPNATAAQKHLMADLALFLQSNDDVMELDYDAFLRYGAKTGRVLLLSEGSLQSILNYPNSPDAEMLSEDIMTAFTKIGKRYGYEWDMLDHITIGFYPVE